VEQALRGSLLVGTAAAFVWGVLSVLLSPCHLGSIPLVVAWLDIQGLTSPRRAFGPAMFFSGGVALSIAGIGVVTALMGRMLGDLGGWINVLVAGLLLLAGLSLMELVPLSLPRANLARARHRGWLGAILLGLLFGAALGPCTFAFMAPVLGATLLAASTNTVASALLLGGYALGHTLTIALAGTFGAAVQGYLEWHGRGRWGRWARRGLGLLLIAVALYLVLWSR
jgi:cytochrome c-type biogenesis protein